jgi:sugar/nucleoside kinase (ribokinase family)
VFDPGPLAGELPAEPLRQVLGRIDWLSANRREAGHLTAIDDPAEAAARLVADGAARRGAVVRDGADGCWVATPGAAPIHVPVPIGPVAVADTSGAGDTHVGAFVAALARGESPPAAARWANAAAARCVTARGPAHGPPYEVTRADLAGTTPRS